MKSTTIYECLSGKCKHNVWSKECGNMVFAKFMSRVGDPTLLDETELLSKIFWISGKLSNKEVTHDKEFFAWGVDNSDPDFGEQYTDVLRICVIILYSAMGIFPRDDDKGILISDSMDTDYGYGPGAAVTARDEWLIKSVRGLDSKESKRGRTVCSLMASMISRNMVNWALELYSFLLRESLFMRLETLPDKTADIMLAIKNRLWHPPSKPNVKDKGAPIFSECLVQFSYEIDEVSRKSKEMGTQVIQKINDEEETRCKCGITVIIVQTNSSPDYYELCPITTINGKGCKYWTSSKIKQ